MIPINFIVLDFSTTLEMTVKMLEMTNSRIPDSGPNYSLIIIFLRYRAYWMQKMMHIKVRAQRSEVNSF